MDDIAMLIARCREMGATFVLLGDNRIKVRSPQPLPDDLLAALREAKPRILAEILRQEQEAHRYWVLEEWRQWSLPSWRRILKESIETRDRKRE